MEHRIPVAGEFYRHISGDIYQIKMVAKDSETEKAVVVYQGMFPPFAYWVKPLEDFLAPAEGGQHPYAGQAMCFERMEANELKMAAWKETAHDGVPSGIPTEDTSGQAVQDPVDSAGVQAGAEDVDDTLLVKALQSGQPEKYLSGRMTDREIAERGCMKILDAETFHEKRQLMVGMKPYLDKRLLHNIAAALDIVLEEGDLESQYDSLLHCLDTIEHFEGRRLR